MRPVIQFDLDYDDVLIKPQRSTIKSRSEVDLERHYFFYHSKRTWSGIPIFCSNMASIAGKEMALALAEQKICTALHKYHSIEELIEIFLDDTIDITNDREILRTRYQYIWPSIGNSINDIAKIKELTSKTGFAPNIIIDVPNGHMENFVSYCTLVRETFPDSIIMAGNVAIENSTAELILHGGVDIVKVQIGPGKMCETRKVTGVGRGTLSCIMDCSFAAHGLKSRERHLGLICTDGGCKTSGDVAKSFVAGADFSMLGQIFAGSEECCGEWEQQYEIEIPYTDSEMNPTKVWRDNPDAGHHLSRWTGNTKKINLIHYGMSSHHAQIKHATGVKPYRASEGKVSKIPYKGPVKDVVQELLGGLRSCGAYIGAKSIKDFSKCGEFVQVSRIHQDAN